jgi:hypothetical protein
MIGNLALDSRLSTLNFSAIVIARGFTYNLHSELKE